MMENLNRQNLHEGMTVLSSDGEKLGKVKRLGQQSFAVQKGLFFIKDYAFDYDYIADIRNDDILLKYSADEVLGGEVRGRSYGMDTRETDLRDNMTEDEMRIPLKEEELEVQKRTRNKGQVKVKKEVRTETKHIEVPVSREEVIVERVGAESARSYDNIDDNFSEETIVIPIRGEEIEIHKRPVVREEIRVRRQVRQESQGADATIRKETAVIDEDKDRLREPRFDKDTDAAS